MVDMILYNGRLHTLDPRYEGSTAIAVRCGHITAVGDDSNIRELAEAGTRQVDLGGRRVLPGLVDSHFHLFIWALNQRGIGLQTAGSLDQLRLQVQQPAANTDPGQWIVGWGWNQEEWPDRRLPNRRDLDDLTPDNPIILWRSDGHLALVNTKALQAAGIGNTTPDPESGIIDRDNSGQATGILREAAINLVSHAVPSPGDAEASQLVKHCLSSCHQLGLTGGHDMGAMGGNSLAIYQQLHARGEFDFRMWLMLPLEQLDEAIDLGLRTGFGDDFLRIGGIKLFADGSTGARTAWMLEPFEDGSSGMPVTPMKDISHIVKRANLAGLSTATHAIGDRCIRELLNVYEDLDSKSGKQHPLPAPNRIEHVQHSHPDDLKRLAPLNLTASVQPIHATDDMVMVDQVVGQRGRWTYAFRNLLDAGTILALGSDCPVASPNPFWGIHAAVTRQRRDGTPNEGWYPEQSLSVKEAVAGYTIGPARATGQAARLGSLTPGRLADFIALDRDILAVAPTEIAGTKVDLTVVGGQIVFSSEDFSG